MKEFIEHELDQEFRQSPNIISIYIDSLFKRFRTEQETGGAGNWLTHYNDTVARGIASQAEIMRQKAELEEAVTTYDIAKDKEIRELKHDRCQGSRLRKPGAERGQDQRG